MANSSTHSGSAISPADAVDPALCRVSGYLRDLQGNPLKGLELTIRHDYMPLAAVGGSVFLQERITARADHTGLVEFDLVRGSSVYVELPNFIQDYRPLCIVPDAASIDLVDFLFPTVASLAFDDSSPVTASVGDALELTLTGTLTNGETLEVPPASLTLVSSAEAVLERTTEASFTAQSVGSADVSVDAVDVSLFGLNELPDGTAVNLSSIPTPTFPAPLTVNVT